MTWLEIAIGILAVYALAFTGAKLEGPFGIAKAIRVFLQDFVLVHYEEDSRVNPVVFEEYKWYWLYDGVACPFCHSFWWAWIVLAAVMSNLLVLDFFVYGLAFSGAAMLLFNLAGE